MFIFQLMIFQNLTMLNGYRWSKRLRISRIGDIFSQYVASPLVFCLRQQGCYRYPLRRLNVHDYIRSCVRFFVYRLYWTQLQDLRSESDLLPIGYIEHNCKIYGANPIYCLFIRWLRESIQSSASVELWVQRVWIHRWLCFTSFFGFDFQWWLCIYQ
jgi:hypothetical protein